MDRRGRREHKVGSNPAAACQPKEGTLRTKKKGRLLLAAAVVATGAIVGVSAMQASAQDQTGAEATKECPQAPVNDPYTIGDTVTCTAVFTNEGALPATVTEMIDIAPFVSVGSPANGAPMNLSCTLPDGTVITTGSTIPSGVPCTAVFQVTIPNDPALCNSVFRDLAQFALSYPQFSPPLEAGAFATHTLLVVCLPSISVTKTASPLSKIGDPVNYVVTVCNTGLVAVNRTSVIDVQPLIGDITPLFPATLAPGQCATVNLSRLVGALDPDPLPNTVTAIFATAAGVQATAQASASTNLFQPGVDVTKSCGPSPIQVGQNEVCTITITNTSSGDSPILENGTISDSLSGNLLDPANTAVTASTCTATLASGASCTITTSRTVLSTDVSPLTNTVTVHYNPDGFTNDITDTASASVIIEVPAPPEGCTPGFWKQPQHFDSWVGFTPNQSFDTVFGVDVTIGGFTNATLLQALNAGGGGINALARHAVAALLNSTNPDVDFAYTTAEVIDLVQDAIASGDYETAKNLLAAANEAGCPLS